MVRGSGKRPALGLDKPFVPLDELFLKNGWQHSKMVELV